MSDYPSVTLKLATSLDGRIAAASGQSKWITGQKARDQVHRLRAAHGAVLVGGATVAADDPELTVRLKNYKGRQPLRVVASGALDFPLGSKLVTTARETPTLVLTRADAPADRRAALEEAGVTVRTVEDSHGLMYPTAMLKAISAELGERAADGVFLEGGAKLASSFIWQQLVERIEWFRAPMLIGHDGLACVGPLAVTRLIDGPRFRRVEVREVGPDLWERYEKP